VERGLAGDIDLHPQHSADSGARVGKSDLVIETNGVKLLAPQQRNANDVIGTTAPTANAKLEGIADLVVTQFMPGEVPLLPATDRDRSLESRRRLSFYPTEAMDSQGPTGPIPRKHEAPCTDYSDDDPPDLLKPTDDGGPNSAWSRRDEPHPLRGGRVAATSVEHQLALVCVRHQLTLPCVRQQLTLFGTQRAHLNMGDHHPKGGLRILFGLL